jgi:opacity protein-like surface antigen
MRRVFATFAAIISMIGAGAGVAEAQKPPRSARSTPPAAADRPYGEFTFGPTFGNASSASFGVEGGYWFTHLIGVFVEGGRIRDVATSNIEDHARIIAAEIGATASARQPVNYFDVGVLARIPISAKGRASRLTPYALFGLGAANVSNNVTFAVNGATLSPQQLADLGVSLGSDLSGSYTKLFITLGAGTHIALTGRWVADASYRYGSIGKNTDDPFTPIDAISTNRFQFGIGVTF